MRIIAGEFRRRHIKSVPGLDVRPTPDRLRESLFNVLAPGLPALCSSTPTPASSSSIPLTPSPTITPPPSLEANARVSSANEPPAAN